MVTPGSRDIGLCLVSDIAKFYLLILMMMKIIIMIIITTTATTTTTIDIILSPIASKNN